MSVEETILKLTSPDNAVRGEAERLFNNATAQPEALLVELINVMRSSVNPDARSMASVLFRRYSFEEEKQLWSKCNPVVQNQIKGALIQIIANEPERSIRQKIGHVISSTAKFTEGNWPELLQYLFQCFNSPSESHKETALLIFRNVPTIFGDTLQKYAGVLRDVLFNSLADPSPKIKIASLCATSSFLCSLDNQLRAPFGDLLLPMLQAVHSAISTNDEDASRDSIESLVELVEVAPTLFRKSLDEYVKFFAQVTGTASLDDGIRQLAAEFLVTLAEVSPGMVRKYQPFVELAFPCMLSLMVDLEDDQEWHNAETTENDEMDSNSIAGEQAVDRIACALGGKAVVPFAFKVISGMLKDQNWTHRYAGLMTISAIGEGCAKAMENELESIITTIIPYLNDPHPRVRYAVCNTIGQMSTDFAPIIEKLHHAKLVPALLTAITDVSPRVQAHAAAALVNFSENATKQILEPYLDQILNKLYELIGTPKKKYVMEQAITTLATVADSAEDKFDKYYGIFMPVLIDILGKAADKEYRLLRGKTMECISLIGLAVGKEKFFNDAKKVMEILMYSQAAEMEPDDPQVSYMLSSWTRIGAVLGLDFVPYLPTVMPPLLRSAKLKPDVAILGPDDTNAEGYDAGWEFVTVEDQKIGIKTSNLEEKCTAVEMLYCFAKELKGGFHQYVTEVMQIVIPLLKFYFDDGVRIAAAITIPPLIKCAQEANYDKGLIQNMWASAIDPLLEVSLSESETEVLTKFLSSFHECVEAMGPNCLSKEHLDKVCSVVVNQLNEVSARMKQRRVKRQGDDCDEELEEALENEDMNDDDVLREISEVIHVIFKTHRNNFLPSFESIIVTISQIIAPDRTNSERQWGLCIFDDLIEFTGELSWKYKDLFLKQMVEAILDQAPEIRQAAAYGAGVCGMYGGENYSTVCAESLPRLFQMINAQNSRDEECNGATENAVSAIGKIIQFNHSKFDVNQVLFLWLNSMPIVYDSDEAKISYSFLCSLIEGNNPIILGQNNANLPKIFSVMIEPLANETIDDEVVVNRMVNIVKQINTQVSEQVRASLWANVSDYYKQVLLPMLN